MATPLGDLLSRRNYEEPPEIKLIKDFVQSAVGITPRVKITPETYVLSLPSAAAAGALRAHLFKLQQELGGNKRILIRIG
jgi:hypothetical protein